jgi:DNA (cytosine-5)-methyltransferase 1
MKSVELFSGCGGLALGLSRAGFEHVVMVERNADAVATIKLNKDNGVDHIKDWNVIQDDVRDLDWRPLQGIDLVAGGPPCQPFSIGGVAAGPEDERDMWPEAIRAVNEMWPKAFLFENVRGLGRPIFRDYFEWIQAALGRPHITRKNRETHARHMHRLEREELAYKVIALSVNAADFGAPQKRHRIIIAGVRADHLGVEITPPERAHSKERLEWEQVVSGHYWKRHRLSKTHSHKGFVDQPLVEPEHRPWVTVRDTFQGLGQPNNRGNHVLQPGARQYTGHTGSLLDAPAKALKAGVHGVPGGENMVVLDDGSVRYFTIREAARLQGLPDDFEFNCAWSEAMRQLGNAVPAQMSEELGNWMRSMIERK